MRAYLDDAELPGPIHTLAQALDAARAVASAKGRILIEAAADGQPLADSTLENPGSLTAQPASVQFLSAHPASMVREALRGAADALELARDDQAALVASLDAANLDDARSRLDRVLTAWSACVATVRDGGALLNLDLARPVAGQSPNTRVATLSGALLEVKRCLNAQDWAGLSDVVLHDLDPQSRDWDGMLKAMAESLK